MVFKYLDISEMSLGTKCQMSVESAVGNKVGQRIKYMKGRPNTITLRLAMTNRERVSERSGLRKLRELIGRMHNSRQTVGVSVR